MSGAGRDSGWADTDHGEQRVIAWSDQLARSEQVALERERAAYERGHDDGHARGDADGYDRSDREWMTSLAPARDAAARLSHEPERAALEERRWGPGGREHAGDPRPGDFQGRDAERDDDHEAEPS